MASGSNVIDPTEFKFQGQDQTGQSPNNQKNFHPSSQDWQQDPWNDDSKYKPSLDVKWHPDGTVEYYCPVRNVRSFEHTAGHHEIHGPTQHVHNVVGERNEIVASHQRPLWGGHCDENFVCHQRINYGGGFSMVSKGDSASFHSGNHAQVHMGSVTMSIGAPGGGAGGGGGGGGGGGSSGGGGSADSGGGGGGQGGHYRIVLNGDNAAWGIATTTGSDYQSQHTMTNKASWRNMTGDQATVNDKTKSGDITHDSGKNQTDKCKQDWTYDAGGKVTHTSKQDYTINPQASVVLKKKGGMKIPAIKPPSVEVS